MWNNQSGVQSALSSQKPNVTTNITSLFSDRGMLTISIWNERISFTFVPTMEGLDPNSNAPRRYDRERKMNTALSLDKCYTLLNGYEKYLKKYVDGTEEIPEGGKSVGVYVGGNSMQGTAPGVFFITVTKNENGEREASVSIARNVTDQGVQPGNYASYTFEESPLVLDFGPTYTGPRVEESFPSELTVFLAVLKNQLLAFNYVPHAIRYQKALYPDYSGSHSGGSNMYVGGGHNNSGGSGFSLPTPSSSPEYNFNGINDDEIPFN